MELSTVINTIFVVLYSITIIGLVLLVLLENRNPLKTIPWVIVLIFVPGIGLVFYYFFGRENRRLHIISRRIHRRFHKQAGIESRQGNLSEIPKPYLPLANLLRKSNYSAIFNGNDIAFFTSGKDKFDALFADIRAARHHIHLQYYIFNQDKIGNIVKQMLIEKVREGVEVRVLYDDVGSWGTKNRFFDEMTSEGIEIHPYLKVAFPILTSKVNYRNHRKVVVIDGNIGYMGGMNIADRYVYGNKLGQWRDTHFRITGPIVHGLQSSFLLDWYAMSRKFVKGKEYYPHIEKQSDIKMQLVTSGPTNTWLTLMQAYIFCISNAKKYIYIQTPYFLPSEALAQSLTMAALGGIDVRLMIPILSDTRSAQMATFSYVQKMLESGVKVYLYNNGFLHSKLVLVDDILTAFGSPNFDFRSFEHNFEITAFTYNEDFAGKMKSMFMQDIRYCEEIFYPSWRRRPLTRRLTESFMRLFAPLL